jgi:alpha-1,3-rhamnosyl/mannosyltransferase
LDAFQVMTDHAYLIYPGQLRAVLIPDLSVLHVPQCHTQGTNDWWQKLFEHARNHADLVFTFSEDSRSDVTASLGIPPEKIAAVPLAADPCYKPILETEVRARLSTWGLEYGKYLLTVSAIEPRKNHRTLFRAYAQYRRRMGPDSLPLVVAGAPAWLYQEILDEPARLGISDAIRFVGKVDGLEYLYNGARALVYPSLFEGFGLPPLEAMACGTPVVVSNATSLPEVVQDAGLFFSPLDELALAEHLAQITADAATRERCSARGLAVASQFSWRRTAEMYLAALQAQPVRVRAVRHDSVASCA